VDSNHKAYEHTASFARLDAILDQADVNYEQVNSLPDRDKLTFSNGFYANCSALFVDIRGSSELPKKLKRPSLARLYRAYISELVAVMNGDPDCREINIVGDGVWCVVNTPLKRDIDFVFSTAAKAHSLVKTLNCKLKKRGKDPIRVGIGMDWGRALMIKAGYSGSGINDVVYMGDVVNSAAKLASKGDMGWLVPGPLMVGSDFYTNLNDHNKSLLSWNSTHACYSGSVVNVAMDEWYKANCG
jgi:class 3 adenylate cyclase